MKNLLCIMLCFTLLACKEQKTTEKPTAETAEVNDTPKKWLTFNGAGENAKHIVLISGDEEYRSEEALPQLAKILSKHHGFDCTVLFAQEESNPGIINANHLNNIPGLEVLTSADLMVIFTRFRALPDEQMQHIDNYLNTGKPVVGIRTATHAFNFKEDSLSNFRHYGNFYEGEKKEWEGGFGRLVLGEKWISHHGHHKHQSTRGIVAKEAKSTGITNGISDGDVWGASDVYEVRLPQPGDSQPVILGQVMNRNGEYDESDVFFGMKPTDDKVAKTNNEGKLLDGPLMPVAWTKSYQLPEGKKGKVFASTVGAANDMLIEGTRRLLVNGVFWALDMKVPEKADVSLVGDYDPTKFEFRDEQYWLDKQLAIESFE